MGRIEQRLDKAVHPGQRGSKIQCCHWGRINEGNHKGTRGNFVLCKGVKSIKQLHSQICNAGYGVPWNGRLCLILSAQEEREKAGQHPEAMQLVQPSIKNEKP